jgi:hypothetical protein
MTRDDVLTPGQLADAAAEAVRSQNHATFPGSGGLTWPGDGYDVIAFLSLLAARLPQAFGQLDRFLTAQVESGRVVIDGGEFSGDPAAAIATASHWLEQASAAAGQLAHALDQGQQAIAYAAAADA